MDTGNKPNQNSISAAEFWKKFDEMLANVAPNVPVTKYASVDDKAYHIKMIGKKRTTTKENGQSPGGISNSEID